MKCIKCNKIMTLKYVMETDGTFKLIWTCPDCKQQEYAIGRNC